MPQSPLIKVISSTLILIRRLSERLGSAKIWTTAYHPQASGQVKRWHRVLKAAIIAYPTQKGEPEIFLSRNQYRGQKLNSLRLALRILSKSQSLYRGRPRSEFLQVPELISWRGVGISARPRAYIKRRARNFYKSQSLYKRESSEFV